MNFEIPKLAWLKAVMLAAGKDNTRYYLSGVMVRNGEIASASDRMMLLIQSKSIKSDGEYIINKNTLKMILMSKQDGLTDTSVKVVDGVTTTGKTQISITRVNRKFPDIRQFIPQYCTGEIAHFDCKYLLACQKANKKFLGRKNHWIKLQHNGQAGARFESEDDAGNKLIGVVMPVRM